jgi:hypothetical protein
MKGQQTSWRGSRLVADAAHLFVHSTRSSYGTYVTYCKRSTAANSKHFIGPDSPPGPSSQCNCIPPCKPLNHCMVFEGRVMTGVHPGCQSFSPCTAAGVRAAGAEAERAGNHLAGSRPGPGCMLDCYCSSEDDQVSPGDIRVRLLDGLQPVGDAETCETM